MGRRRVPLGARPKLEGRAQAEILRAAVAGEPWAHAGLYDALYPIVTRALQRVLRQESDYEDLVQTSFELIVRTLQKPGAREIQNLANLSSAIAARVALDSLRSRIRERKVFDRDEEALRAAENVPGARLERQLDVRRELIWLERTLAAMNAMQAETVLLHDVLGHDVREIAELTSATHATAQKRLSRGHSTLKKRAKQRRA